MGRSVAEKKIEEENLSEEKRTKSSQVLAFYKCRPTNIQFLDLP